MKETYRLTVAGVQRDLPICPVNENLSIAGFVMFGDVEITIAAAAELLKKVGDFDIMVTAESKGIPLTYEMARQSGKPYVLARKSIKLYMSDPVSVSVKSITTAQVQTLYMDSADMALLHGKRVLLVDDVISTGDSMNALANLVEKAEGVVVGKCAVLAEGDAGNRDDIIFLEKLPLFFK